MLVAKKIQKALQHADHLKAKHAVIIGKQELDKNSIQIKEMESRKTEEISLSNLIDYFSKRTSNGL